MHDERLRYRLSERGSFLLPVLVLTLLLGGLSVAMLHEAIAERTAIHHHETSMHALELAEVGVVRAEMEISSLKDLAGDGIGTMSGAYAEGTFDVRATRNPSYPDRWTLRATGERGLSIRRIEVGIRRREAGFFLEGLYSRLDLTGNGTVSTDSYDSRLGTWDAQAANADAGGRYARGNGHVGSNSGIRFTGTSVHIRGNAIPGPLTPIDLSGAPDIWGDTMPREREIPLPPPSEEEFRKAVLANDNAQLLPPLTSKKAGYDEKKMSLRPIGQEVVHLKGGTYFFTDIVLAGGASIVLDGPCRIYVTGEVDLTGGSLVNPGGAAPDCLIFAHPYPIPAGFIPSTKPIAINGGPGVAAGIYAPYRDVTVGGGPDYFGSIVGQDIHVNGDTAFHYDEALRTVDGGTVVFMERLYWRDTSVPRR
jgi:hypothetical protein